MPPRRRPLSVLDLLILVAATAVGLAVTRTLPDLWPSTGVVPLLQGL